MITGKPKPISYNLRFEIFDNNMYAIFIFFIGLNNTQKKVILNVLSN